MSKRVNLEKIKILPFAIKALFISRKFVRISVTTKGRGLIEGKEKYGKGKGTR